MTSGVPGSGKTTFRDNKFNKTPQIICPDSKIPYTKKEPWSFQRVKQAWRESDEELKIGIEDPNKELILFDATFVGLKKRKKYLNIVKKANMHPIVIYVNPSLDICIARNEAREESRKVPLWILKNMSNNLKSPTVEEGFHIVIDVERKIVYHDGCGCLEKLSEVVNLSGYNKKKEKRDEKRSL